MNKKDKKIEKYIEGCRKGDSLAQFQLFDMFSKAMYNVAYRFFFDEMIAEDVVQESFILAFKNIKKFKGDSTFGYWLKRIVINKSITEVRKQKVKFESLSDRFNDIESDDVDESIDYSLLYKAIEKLPQSARIILNLYVFEEYKHQDIASALGITESTSRTQYRRAKMLLLEQLEPLRSQFA